MITIKIDLYKYDELDAVIRKEIIETKKYEYYYDSLIYEQVEDCLAQELKKYDMPNGDILFANCLNTCLFNGYFDYCQLVKIAKKYDVKGITLYWLNKKAIIVSLEDEIVYASSDLNYYDTMFTDADEVKLNNLIKAIEEEVKVVTPIIEAFAQQKIKELITANTIDEYVRKDDLWYKKDGSVYMDNVEL
jgi:hypothetical protein